jgi:hypothetical protein
MKNIFLVFFIVLLFLKGNSQEENSVDFKKLAVITEKSDFAGLCKLVSSLGYKVLDSSKDKNGSLFYFAKEFKFHGSSLACSRNNQLKITELSFMTFDEDLYKRNKLKLKEVGFKSQGIHKGGLPGITESEDFEKGKILVSSAISKKDNEDPLYEFTFINW